MGTLCVINNKVSNYPVATGRIFSALCCLPWLLVNKKNIIIQIVNFSFTHNGHLHKQKVDVCILVFSITSLLNKLIFNNFDQLIIDNHAILHACSLIKHNKVAISVKIMNYDTPYLKHKHRAICEFKIKRNTCIYA